MERSFNGEQSSRDQLSPFRRRGSKITHTSGMYKANQTLNLIPLSVREERARIDR